MLRFNPQIALALGDKEAILIAQIEYWTERGMGKLVNGYRWIYNSVRQWQEDNFPFWSVNTIDNKLKRLIELGVLETGQFNKSKFDKTKWYRVNYDVLNELLADLEPEPPTAVVETAAAPVEEVAETAVTEPAAIAPEPAQETAVSPDNPTSKDWGTDSPEIGEPIPETTSITTQEGRGNAVTLSPALVISLYQAIFKYKPKRGQAETAVERVQKTGFCAKTFTLTCQLWLLAGHNPFNVAGILDWYENLRRDPNWKPYQNGQKTAVSSGDKEIWQLVKRCAAASNGASRLEPRMVAAMRRCSGLWPSIQQMNSFQERELKAKFLEAYHAS